MRRAERPNGLMENQAVTVSSVGRGEAAWRMRWKLWRSPPMWRWRSMSPIGSSAPGDPQGIQMPSAVKVWSLHASCVTSSHLCDQNWLQWVSLSSCRRLWRIPLSAKEEALLPGWWLLALDFFFVQTSTCAATWTTNPCVFHFSRLESSVGVSQTYVSKVSTGACLLTPGTFTSTCSRFYHGWSSTWGRMFSFCLKSHEAIKLPLAKSRHACPIKLYHYTKHFFMTIVLFFGKLVLAGFLQSP